jgi:hypothetical protein
MTVKKAVLNHINALTNPKNEFSHLHKLKFETALSDYLKVLLLIGILTAVFNFVYYVLRSIYYNLFYSVEIAYLRMFNYSSGQSIGTVFFYLFAGTFFVFVISIILHPFFRKIRYTDFLKLIFFALSPLLLFSWINIAIPGLLIWSIILFIVGIRTALSAQHSKKGTIEERD